MSYILKQKLQLTITKFKILIVVDLLLKWYPQLRTFRPEVIPILMLILYIV